jgi:two-component system alkaline phosphatase synthesis response regulator PhoP
MTKLLIIDDEPDAVNMMKDFLAARGYQIAAAYDGEEGLRKFDSENPDLVICDIRMPKKDGFQFLQELRTSRKWVPVIIITALSEPVNILKGYDFEADYYITKPINLPEVLKAVQIMLSLIPLRKR